MDDQKGSQQFGVGQILGETVAENTWAGNRDRYDCSSAVSSLSGPPTPRRRGARAELDACWRCYGLSESHRGHCHESSWRNPTTGTLLSAQHAVWDTQKLNNSNNGPPTPTGNRLASNLVTCAEGFPSRGGPQAPPIPATDCFLPPAPAKPRRTLNAKQFSSILFHTNQQQVLGTYCVLELRLSTAEIRGLIRHSLALGHL